MQNPGVVFRTTSQPMVPRNRIISDLSAFYGITNADPIAFGEDVKAGELYNLLSTLVGDEPFLPTYGCDLPRRVFQPINARLRQELFLDVYVASQTWVPDIPVDANRSRIIATSGNRVAGVVVAYRLNGHLWELPIGLAGNSNFS